MKKEIKIVCVYKITSPSNKIYIGKTGNFKVRIQKYRTLKCKSQIKLYSSLKKYGFKNHKFDIIKCEESQLNYLEMYLIRFYDTFDTKHGLNLREGGEGGKMSDDTRKKMSINRLNRCGLKYENGELMSEEHKQERRKEYLIKYDIDDKEKAINRKKRYYIVNKQLQLDRAKKWREENNDRVKQNSKNYWIANKELISKKREKNKSKKREYDKKYYRERLVSFPCRTPSQHL